MGADVKTLIDKIDTSVLITRSTTEWRPVLAEECQVYVIDEGYLAKRFDQINYKLVEKNEAREILIDNLYALLRYKYFPKSTEEIDDRIDKIVKSFTANLKTTLKRVSFDSDTDATYIKLLPDYCVAFRNGVFNFKDNKWLFKYNTIKLDRINNTIYLYDPSYAIMWYMNYEFEPFKVDIMKTSIEKFIDIMKDYTKEKRNYCFELLYNIAHDIDHNFNIDRFCHLSEILGYTVLQSFSQYFVMLIGSGQNGKNSLFDGCFTNRLVPRPASNDLDAIEQDRFITGSLVNKAHNIFLETSAKTYTESKMIKALTGSMYQTIESKGVSKYSGFINCKYVFAGNDQEKIKFTDTTTGFRRRINMFEIFYRWDKRKSFMTKGDYYDTTFSDSLYELKTNPENATAYIYFAMYGIRSATKNFTSNFQFNFNDWNYKYTDVDMSFKDRIEEITREKFLRTLADFEDPKTALFDTKSIRLYNSGTMSPYGVTTYPAMIDMFNDPESFNAYFIDNDIYMSVKFLQSMTTYIGTQMAFTQTLKKTYMFESLLKVAGNQSAIKVTFKGGRLKIVS